MAVAVLLEGYILSGKKLVVELEVALEEACRTLTRQLWVDCFIKPVMMVHLYIRAECEGPWQYFKYTIWYILEMRHHVYRHKEGAWKAVFSDPFGEQMCIRHSKARGGLVGKILSLSRSSGQIGPL